MSDRKNVQKFSMQKAALVVAFCIFFFCISLALWFYSYTQKTAPSVAGKTVVVIDIPRGASFTKIQGILGDADLIVDDIRFALVAKMIGVSHKLRAGEFALTTEQKPADLLEELVTAKAVQHRITIPEGLNLVEIAHVFDRKEWCSYDDFIQATENPSLLKKLGLKEESSMEGYLFPDTYQLTRDRFEAKSIVSMMVARFQQVYEDVGGGNHDPEKRHEIVTLASIVEKEAAKSSEQERIAGVFTNRLRINMRLQSDPTVTYGVEGHEGPITRTDLRRETPYNTYVISGLPPTPIASPGKGALYATIHPEKHKYLYFVADTKGGHVFSTNLKDHNRAVRSYRQKIKQMRGQ